MTTVQFCEELREDARRWKEWQAKTAKEMTDEIKKPVLYKLWNEACDSIDRFLTMVEGQSSGKKMKQSEIETKCKMYSRDRDNYYLEIMAQWKQRRGEV